MAAAGGTPPYVNWAIVAGALPPNLAINASTGTISGTPTQAGTFNFTVQVTDNAQASATKAFSLTVNPVTVPAANIPTLGPFALGALALLLALFGMQRRRRL